MKNIILLLLLNIVLIDAVIAQNVEIDFGIGVHLSNINFHHTSEVTSDEASEFQAYDNSNFNVGITSPIDKRNLYLKTEIGFFKTNSFFAVRYRYDEGFGEQNGNRITYLTNQKMYLGILPEYRYSSQSFIFKFTGGVLFSSDISNTYSTSNTILLTKSMPIGLKIGVGAQHMWNKIGVEFRASYVKFGQSELQNRYHPKVSYDLVLLNMGIVYSL